MDAYLAQLVRQNKIDRSIAEERCYDPLSLNAICMDYKAKGGTAVWSNLNIKHVNVMVL